MYVQCVGYIPNYFGTPFFKWSFSIENKNVHTCTCTLWMGCWCTFIQLQVYYNIELAVLPYHYSVDGFEFTQELSIFDLLGVHLYHGWLADPSDVSAHPVVSRFSYNQLVEFAISNLSASDSLKQREGTVCMCGVCHGGDLRIITCTCCTCFCDLVIFIVFIVCFCV